MRFLLAENDNLPRPDPSLPCASSLSERLGDRARRSPVGLDIADAADRFLPMKGLAAPATQVSLFDLNHTRRDAAGERGGRSGPAAQSYTRFHSIGTTTPECQDARQLDACR